MRRFWKRAPSCEVPNPSVMLSPTKSTSTGWVAAVLSAPRNFVSPVSLATWAVAPPAVHPMASAAAAVGAHSRNEGRSAKSAIEESRNRRAMQLASDPTGSK